MATAAFGQSAFVSSEDIGFPDGEQIQVRNKYVYVNNLFKSVVPAFQDIMCVDQKNNRSFEIADLTVKEFDLVCRHNMESAVELAYKMLSGCIGNFSKAGEHGMSKDVQIVLRCMRFLHDKRVPPEYVPGFLLLIVKYHFFN